MGSLVCVSLNGDVMIVLRERMHTIQTRALTRKSVDRWLV